VQHGDTLYSISRRYGMSVDELASINGLYRPYPALSVGQNLFLSRNNNAVPSSSPSATTAQYHIVQAGDNLYRIALKYGYKVDQVANWNNLRPPYNLSAGQRLIVSPNSGLASQQPSYYNSNTYTPYTPPPPTNSNSSNYSLLSSTRVKTPATPTPAPAPLAVNSPSYHIVKNSETLSSIAKKYDVTTHELAIWNGIGTPYTVFPGQKLLIP
jgi:LysM repeat protein